MFSHKFSETFISGDQAAIYINWKYKDISLYFTRKNSKDKQGTFMIQHRSGLHCVCLRNLNGIAQFKEPSSKYLSVQSQQ